MAALDGRGGEGKERKRVLRFQLKHETGLAPRYPRDMFLILYSIPSGSYVKFQIMLNT